MSSPQQILGQFVRNIFKIKRHNMFEVPIPNQQVLAKTRVEINNKLAKYYKDPLMKQFLKSLPPKCLLDQSVVMFVGSRTRPQNVPLRNQLIQLAIQKAEKQQAAFIKTLTPQQKANFIVHKSEHVLNEPKSQKRSSQRGNKRNQVNKKEDNEQQQTQIFIPTSQKHLAKYYTHAFTKYEAMQKNQPQRWQSCAQTIIDLADKGHPLSSMMLAKDYYFRIDSAQLSKQKKSQLVIEAAQYFYQSVTETNLNGLYYIGQMLEEYPQLNQSTPQQVQELYIYAAANGNPLAYAKLAQMHKRKGDMKLYMNYLKQSAEGGCIQAQFNLGEQYRLGLNVKKDEVKAFSWFKHSGAHGFVYGKFNEALMLYHGSECGRIKRNVKAALLQFEQIQRSNTIDVTAQIEQIMKEQEIMKELEEAMKQEAEQQKDKNKKIDFSKRVNQKSQMSEISDKK